MYLESMKTICNDLCGPEKICSNLKISIAYKNDSYIVNMDIFILYYFGSLSIRSDELRKIKSGSE